MKMEGNEVNLEQDVARFASAVGLDVSQAERIPPDLRMHLLKRLSNPSGSILQNEQQNVSTSNSNEPGKEVEDCPVASYLPEKPQEYLYEQTDTASEAKALEGEKFDDGNLSQEAIQKQLEEIPYDFPTATDALASEAAFMENIGLYLNPRQSIPLGRTATPAQRERMASDCIDTADILMWCDQANSDMNQFVDSPSKPKSQQSLLSFLNKAKSAASEEPSGRPSNEAEAAMAPVVKWRLWNPDQENLSQDELWNDIFSSAAEYIANDTDPTLMEMSSMNLSTNHESDVTGEPEHFCKPCGRSLCSKEALYRHNLSELHFKRTLATWTNDEMGGRCKKRPQTSAAEKPNVPLAKKTPISSRGPCLSCNAVVPEGCMGKHLISHFHHHRSIGHPMHPPLILHHIHDIVKQAPFQCHLCMFYCNFEQQFLQHWSRHHGETLSDDSRGYWCSACRVIVPTEAAMRQHLVSEVHLELVTMINRSVAIVIKKVQLINCDYCPKRFRLGFSLRRHLKDSHPEEVKKAPPPTSQNKCHHCTFATQDGSKLREHHFLAHVKKKDFSCLTCRRAFSSRYALQNHKSSKEHLKKRGSYFPCLLCGRVEPDAASWEQHMKQEHWPEMSQCYVCGQVFTSPQRLSSHVRLEKCSVDGKISKVPKDFKVFACDRCPFAGKSAQLLQVHDQMVHHALLPELTRSKVLKQLNRKSNEKRCTKCNQVFVTGLAARTHECSVKISQFSCQECDFVTHKETSLKSHALVHARVKPRLECSLCSRSFPRKSELNRHVLRQHTEGARLRCPSCAYSTFSRQHLTRHLQTMHSRDDQRFFCRLCTGFSSGTLENLRKHILKTNKHPGCFVYICPLCQAFESNGQAAFKAHLRRWHPSQNADALISAYFNKEQLRP